MLTKLDMLTGLETIPVCVAYDVDGVRFDEVPVTQSDFHHAVPIYEYFPGLDGGHLGRARRSTTCRRTRRTTCSRSRRMSGTRISAIGVGPDRDAIVVRHDLIG